MLHAGLDLSRRKIDVCLLSAGGVIVEEFASPPDADGGVRRGEAAVSRAMTRRLIERFRRAPDGSSGLRPIKSPLTAREWEVIDLLKPGHSPDEVAEALVLSPETVRSHVKNIMRKLEVHSRADAVAAAERLRSPAPDAPSLRH